jgi:dTDP-4-amino-4,6-dideoxygalactose transaminase
MIKVNNRKQIDQAIKRVLNSGWFILGQEVKQFEREFAKYIGVKYCIGVGNGLEALQISLMSLGIGEGDEVITTPISAVATTLAILAVRATPVFVDTNENGLINPALIEKALTKKTKAILPVHLYGQSAELEKIQLICKKNGLFLIEDACQAHGSTIKGKKLGSFGVINAFSFYPTKNLGALGDGGAIVTNNAKLAKICQEIRDYGQVKKYQHQRYGLNSRLDELQAAVLRVKLQSLDKENRLRQKIAYKYVNHIRNILGVRPVIPQNIEEWNVHILAVKSSRRKELLLTLNKNGVQPLIHYPKTIPDQPFLVKEFSKLDIPVARKFVQQVFSLPVNPKMSDKEIAKVLKSF